MFSVRPDDLSVLSGATVAFYCQALSNPAPTFSWLKNSEPLQFSDRIRASSGKELITLDKVTDQDAGTYTCVASNRYGKAKAPGKLMVDGVSGK